MKILHLFFESSLKLRIIRRSITLLTETTILLRIAAIFGASSVSHQEHGAFEGIKGTFSWFFFFFFFL